MTSRSYCPEAKNRPAPPIMARIDETPSAKRAAPQGEIDVRAIHGDR
jgi:hypothetical protein